HERGRDREPELLDLRWVLEKLLEVRHRRRDDRGGETRYRLGRRAREVLPVLLRDLLERGLRDADPLAGNYVVEISEVRSRSHLADGTRYRREFSGFAGER